MLYRRISKHLKEQNWFAVWIDLFIVVIGVFIGLQVDSWNESRITKATAKTYYARLVEDLRAEESSRLARIAYYQQVKRHGEAALRALEQPDSELGTQFLIDIYQASQAWPYTPQRATYDELLSGSVANAIPDTKLRSQLANYYVALENSTGSQQETTPYRENLRSHLPHGVQSPVRKYCGDHFEVQANNIGHLTLPETCELTFDPHVISNAITALRSYTDLRTDLTRRLADLETKIWSLNNFIDPTREISKQLEEAIQ